MNLRAVGAECLYILRIWTRSSSHIVMSVIMPVILLLALGFFFGSGGDLPRVHVDGDATTAQDAASAVDALEAPGWFHVTHGPAPDDAASWMHEHGVDALVRLHAGADNGSVERDLLVVDAGGYDGASLARTVRAVLEDPNATASPTAVDVPPPPSYRALLLPGVVGLSIVMTGVSVGFASISELRHHGLLQRLAASPLGKGEWLLGRMVGVGLVSLVGVVVLVAVARVVFGPGFAVGGWTLLLVLGGTLVFAGLGTLLGLAVQRPEAGAAVMNLVLMPLVLLSGAFFDLGGAPAWLQAASAASPLTHLVDGLRADMLGLGDPTVPALAMVGFALLLLGVGGRLIRWTERD